MKNVVDATLIIEDKSFVNKDGEVVDFTSIIAYIDGEDVHLSVKKEDKGLLRILRRGMEQVQ